MEKKKIGSEFKAFIMRGNIADMAIGVVMGTAFGEIVSSVVSDLIMPVVGIISGGIDFSQLKLTVGDTAVTYGAFIQNVIDFLIIALCMFSVIKLMSRLSRKKKEQEEAAPPAKSEEAASLEEIRDLLSDKK